MANAREQNMSTYYRPHKIQRVNKKLQSDDSAEHCGYVRHM